MHKSEPQAQVSREEEQAAILHQQLVTLFHQYRRVPYPQMVVTAYVGYVCYSHGPQVLALTWTVVNIVAPFVRMWAAARYFGTIAQIAARPVGARRLAHAAAFSGLLMGACATLFFPYLALEQQAILTMILCSLAAAALGSSGAYPPSFFAFTIPVLGQLMLAWALSGRDDGLAMVILIGMLLVVLTSFIRENSKLGIDSIRIRFERERYLKEQTALVEQLRVANQRSEELRRAAEEASLSKSRFLAVASHDLRQPLHAISLLVGLLGNGGSGDQREVVGQIRRSVSSLDALFAALLDLSKFDAGAIAVAPRRMPMESLFGGLVSEFAERARAKGLRFESRIASGDVTVDPMLLQRAAGNLLDNAVKYTREGSVVLSARLSRGRLIVAVSDSGAGIPRQERERIFEEFYQIGNQQRERTHGIGLGLAIIRRICALTQSTIVVDQPAMGGSCFTLSMPLADLPPMAGAAPATAAIAIPADTAASLAGVRVLAIDDDEEVRAALRLLFDHWGCVAMIASDLESALRWEAIHADAPEVVLCDLRLAGGQSGIDVLSRLKLRWPAVRAVVITGDVVMASIDSARAAGFEVIHKPVDARRLGAAIRA